MNKVFGWFVVFLLALVATPALAQKSVVCPAKTVAYDVQKGDTLWATFGSGWETLKGANPWIEGRTRRLDKHYTLVLIYPGETLCLPEGSMPAGLKLLTSPSVLSNGETLATPTREPVMSAGTPGFEPGPQLVIKTIEKTPWWVWLVLAAMVFAILYGIGMKMHADMLDRVLRVERDARDKESWARKREEARSRVKNRLERQAELSQNPVTSAPPIVQGGIPATEPERLERHMVDQVTADYSAGHPNATGLTVIRISPIEEGMISGEGMVGYADHARPRRINPPLPGYRARFRFSNGNEHELMALQACMNPVYYGEGLSGFMFVPGRVIVPTPETINPVPVASTAQSNDSWPGQGHRVRTDDPNIEEVPVASVVAPVPVVSVTREGDDLLVAVRSEGRPTTQQATKRELVAFFTYAPASEKGPEMIQVSRRLNYHRHEVWSDGLKTHRFSILPE
ncbi:MAG: hypothetical protein WCP17_02680 [bacterium]